MSKKNKYLKKEIIIIGFLIILFYGVQLYINKLESEDISIDGYTENNIEFASKFIVGISKENVIKTGKTSVWGSGVIISKDGYIVTNAHVAGEKNDICYIIYNKEKSYEGKIVWFDYDLDIAVIKVNANFSDCINIGDSEKVVLGQDVYCIGNPIGLDYLRSVSKGIVSGKNRRVEINENGKKYFLNNLIQIDAAINYGNSGGGLVDNSGNLIGINTIKISGAESIAFAIPINDIKSIIGEYNKNL